MRMLAAIFRKLNFTDPTSRIFGTYSASSFVLLSKWMANLNRKEWASLKERSMHDRIMLVVRARQETLAHNLIPK